MGALSGNNSILIVPCDVSMTTWGLAAQTGKPASNPRAKVVKDPIKNESSNGLSNQRGTLAMARTSVPDSATAQFFINVVDNPNLDRNKCPDGVGYCVFGKVVEGLEVLDKIRAVETTGSRGFPLRDATVKDVLIKSIRRVDR